MLQCLPSFVEIGPPVPEKMFEGFFTIYGHGGHLVMGQVTIMLINFHFPISESLHTKFGSKWPSSI